MSPYIGMFYGHQTNEWCSLKDTKKTTMYLIAWVMGRVGLGWRLSVTRIKPMGWKISLGRGYFPKNIMLFWIKFISVGPTIVKPLAAICPATFTVRIDNTPGLVNRLKFQPKFHAIRAWALLLVPWIAHSVSGMLISLTHTHIYSAALENALTLIFFFLFKMPLLNGLTRVHDNHQRPLDWKI